MTYLIVLDMSAFVDFAVSPVAAALVGFLVSSPNAADSPNDLPLQGIVAFNSAYHVATFGIPLAMPPTLLLCYTLLLVANILVKGRRLLHVRAKPHHVLVIPSDFSS